MNGCRIEGCDRPVYVKKRQLCATHYGSMHRKGQLDELPPTVCSVDGCEARATARELCNVHYKRSRRTGQVRRRTLADRFWRFVEKGPANTCWEWQGATRFGYGQLRVGPTKVGAHRISYELHVGPIPDDLQIDHLCMNRRCVNPAHLEPVTQQVNIMRSNNVAATYARRTECHICGGDLVFKPERGPNGVRVCMTCQNRRSTKNRLKRRERGL